MAKHGKTNSPDPRILEALQARQDQSAMRVDAGKDSPKANELLQQNAEVPFSIRLQAQDRKALTLLANEMGVSSSQLARDFITEGLARLMARKLASSSPANAEADLVTLADHVRTVSVLNAVVEKQVALLLKQQRGGKTLAG